MTYIVRLPWPDRRLSPNARLHWKAKARVIGESRKAAHWFALCDGVRRVDWSSADVSITFFPPDRRRRDLDGMIASLKSLLDGIADALGVDDSRWSLSLARGEPVKGGAVLVKIKEGHASPAMTEETTRNALNGNDNSRKMGRPGGCYEHQSGPDQERNLEGRSRNG